MCLCACVCSRVRVIYEIHMTFCSDSSLCLRFSHQFPSVSLSGDETRNDSPASATCLLSVSEIMILQYDTGARMQPSATHRPTTNRRVTNFSEVGLRIGDEAPQATLALPDAAWLLTLRMIASYVGPYRM